MAASEFLGRFVDGGLKLGIVGQGYVGLPLAEAFADAGLAVLGFDVDEGKVASINRGESYVGDVDSAALKKLVD